MKGQRSDAQKDKLIEESKRIGNQQDYQVN